MAKYLKGFECDKEAKVILKDLVENEWFSSCTIYWNEENDMDEYAPVDLVFTAVTKKENIRQYAIELKERKGYAHDDYQDWMIEPHKLNKLQKYTDYGFKALYFNLFNDGYYYLWDYQTMAKYHKETVKAIPLHTQGDDEEPVMQKRYLISSQKAILSGRTYN